MNEILKEAFEYEGVIPVPKGTVIRSGSAEPLRSRQTTLVYISTQEFSINKQKRRIIVAQIFHPEKCFGVGASSEIAIYECFYNLFNLLRKSGS